MTRNNFLKSCMPLSDLPNSAGVVCAVLDKETGFMRFAIIAKDEDGCHILQDSRLRKVPLSRLEGWRPATEVEAERFRVWLDISLHAKRCPFCKSVSVSTVGVKDEKCTDCQKRFKSYDALKPIAEEDEQHACSLCTKEKQ